MLIHHDASLQKKKTAATFIDVPKKVGRKTERSAPKIVIERGIT